MLQTHVVGIILSFIRFLSSLYIWTHVRDLSIQTNSHSLLNQWFISFHKPNFLYLSIFFFLFIEVSNSLVIYYLFIFFFLVVFVCVSEHKFFFQNA